jgi:hypothetical protein
MRCTVGEGDIVKLTITVTDEQGATIGADAVETTAAAASNGQVAGPDVHDGGPVPDELLAMEAQVAAGLKEVPGIRL